MSRGNRPYCYCYDCLRKFKLREQVSELDDCPACGGDVRTCKNKRTRASTVTRLKRLRGLKPQTPGRPQTDYEHYLASEQWKNIRSRVLFRDKLKCRDCGNKAEQVHHLSYAEDVMEGRDDTQLISICRQCHTARHPDKQRKRWRPPKTTAKPKATPVTKAEKKVDSQNKKRRTAMDRDRKYHERMCSR